MLPIILGFTCGLLVFYLIKKYKQKNVIKYYHPGWIKISQQPIPENKKYYLVTDGEKVDDQISPTFNNKGQNVFDYDKKIITHWMPYPEPPKKE